MLQNLPKMSSGICQKYYPIMLRLLPIMLCYANIVNVCIIVTITAVSYVALYINLIIATALSYVYS